MKTRLDLVTKFPGLIVIHQKIPSLEVGRHQHDEHEIFMPLQGEIAVEFNGKEVKAGPGRMLYVPPFLDHSFRSSAQGSGERVICLIQDRLWKRHGGKKHKPSAFSQNSLAKELFFYLLVHQKAKGASYFISALVETLQDSLQSTLGSSGKLAIEYLSGKVTDSRILKALQLLESQDEIYSLSQIAKLSGLSLRNFNRLFLKECGLSPKDYLIINRVEKAKKLLKETKLTVTDISLEVGYKSLSKFIATFRKITGVLPSDFRNLERS